MSFTGVVNQPIDQHALRLFGCAFAVAPDWSATCGHMIEARPPELVRRGSETSRLGSARPAGHADDYERSVAE
jgi:hypothetical protein